MSLFKVTRFEDNEIGDAACKELFTTKNTFKKKQNKGMKKLERQVKDGKIRKKKIVKVGSVKTKGIKTYSLGNNKIDISNSSNSTKAVSATSKNKKRKLKKNMTLLEHINEHERKEEISNKITSIQAEHKHSSKKVKSVKTNFLEKINKRKELRKNKRKKKQKNVIQEEDNKQHPENVNVNQDVAPELKEKKQDYTRKKQEKIRQKLQQTIKRTPISPPEEKQKTKSLRARMMEKLQAARFRYINEQIYTSDSKGAQKLFSSDPEAFDAYHEGYKQQVNKWPINPLDVVIKSIQKLPKSQIIADFGCGDARLAQSVEHKVHSFDLVAKNEFVTACDMARVPLQKNSVDVAVFCLSLMGTNLNDYLLEANRVLKEGGILKIAEVESRFEDINQFIEAVKKYHFKLTWKDLSHNLFYFLDFKKESNIKNKKKLPMIILNPCLYKKR